MSLPFELPKYHKSNTRYSWKKRGVNMDNFESIYEEYIHQTHCELCNNKFETRTDRCIDHDHETGEFRNIVCQTCNKCKVDREHHKVSNTGLDYIYYSEKKNDYKFEFRRRTINIRVQKTSHDKQFIIDYRDKFLKDHPEYFT